jgi:hypothetical protein
MQREKHREGIERARDMAEGKNRQVRQGKERKEK